MMRSSLPANGSLAGADDEISKFLLEHDLDALQNHAQNLLQNPAASSPEQLSEIRAELLSFLELGRTPAVLRRLQNENRANTWFELLLKIIKKTNFTTGSLIRQRITRYGDKTLLQVATNKGMERYSWRVTGEMIERFGRSMLVSVNQRKHCIPVAVLSTNCPNMVFLDLACLSYGIRNVVISVQSVPAHIEYILNQTRSQILFVANEELLEKVQGVRRNLEYLHTIVRFDTDQSDPDKGIWSLKEFLKRSDRCDPAELESASKKIRLNDLATVMYTSGTTEAPKGIMFSHLNIVTKRFARSIALPEIGDHDVFLCYLPLFHTFGRWFEMLGCVFWGSTYTFMQNPRLSTLLDNLHRVKPTVFISIPKKWIQLYETITDAHPEQVSEAKLTKSVRERTGGRLKWGLSAAGYLDPEIFRFFQNHGIELLSGFGMTEATGGITMTPVQQYRDYSVGKALPGIKIRLAEDGEMMIKGPYVMKGYLQEKSESFRSGWFYTGDIFQCDDDGFYTIIDRKKEIYKNVKGETIAPQKIENLFRDFDAVRSVYLVGDHREYNTVLIYPNYDYEETDLREQSPEQLRELFGSTVVSVNRFLAPFERIVDFELIDRDFSAEQRELTGKGTYKRTIINENFGPVIEKMYSKPFAGLTVSGVDLRLPSWLLRQKGLTANDLKVEKSWIVQKASGVTLTITSRKKEPDKVTLGDCSYLIKRSPVDLGEVMQHPDLWLGNLEFERFFGPEMFKHSRLQEVRELNLSRIRNTKTHRITHSIERSFNKVLKDEIRDLRGLHLSAFILGGDSADLALKAIQYLEGFVKETTQLAPIARLVLQRAAWSKNVKVMRQAFTVLMLNESEEYFKKSLQLFLNANPGVLSKITIAAMCENGLTDNQVTDILSLTGEYHSSENWRRKDKALSRKVLSLLRLLRRYAVRHPVWYKRIRAEFYEWRVFKRDQEITEYVRKSIPILRSKFREWLGPNQKLAVDSDTGREYSWPDVVAFEEDIEETDRTRIADAISEIPLIREAIFIFTSGTLIRLQDISHKGVWVSFLGALHGKSVYRISVQTRHLGLFDLAINLNQTLNKNAIISELDWLICIGKADHKDKLVEDFGGYWPDYGLWTEEFIPGETVSNFFQKQDLDKDERLLGRIQLLWPYVVWNALSAYVDFWRRTDCRLVIADPSPDNVIVPPHDYHVGSRIVSISGRKPFQNVSQLIQSFYENFVKKVEKQHKQLARRSIWEAIFSAFPEVLGEREGYELLQDTLDTLDHDKSEVAEKLPRGVPKKLRSFLHSVDERGFLPQRLHFAIRRFRRWLELNPEAIPLAQMQTLQELYSTYSLEHLEKSYPGARIQYFRHTVFGRSSKKLLKAMDELVLCQKQQRLAFDQLARKISELREQFDLSQAEDFFLTRMTYPHLRHSDEAELISITEEGSQKTDLVVFMKDHYGNVLRIQHPPSPKEIAKLHRLFVQANLKVEFQPDHQFLVVLDERNHVVGGLFYRRTHKTTVHMEKIVVSPAHRRQGISDRLLHEFFNRLQNLGIELVTVGFLRPQFFYRFGFRIDHRYGNMVKQLSPERQVEPTEDLVESVSQIT